MSRSRQSAARRRAEDARPRASFETSLLRRAILGVVILKIVGIVVVVDPGGLNAFDLPKSTFSRAMEWLLLALLLIALARYGRAIVPRTRLHLLVVLFLFANVLAGVFAQNRYVALYGDFGRFLGLTFVVDMAVLYFATAVSVRTTVDWMALGGSAVGALLLATAYAFIQRAGLDPVSWADESKTFVFSTFGNPDMFGHFLSATLGLGLGLALFANGPRPWIVRGVGVLVVLATLADVALVARRGSAGGFAAVVAGAPVLYLRVRGQTPSALLRTVAGSVVGVGAALGFVEVSGLTARVRAELQNPQIADRLTIYRSGLDAFFARPVLGYGPDNFAVAFAQHRLPESNTILSGVALVTSAHSWLLQAASTTGVVGLLALLALLAGFAWAAWRELPRAPAAVAPLSLAVVGYFAHGLVSPSAVMVDWIPWVAFGGIASLRARKAAPIAPRREIRRLAVPLLAVAVLGALTGRSALEANHQAWLAQRVAGQDMARALAAATSAVRLDEGRARYWLILGSYYEQRGQWRAAADAYAEATMRALHNASYWGALSASRIKLAAGGDARSRDAAFDAAERAIAADPNNPTGHGALAQVAYAFGQHDLALREALTAIRLYRNDANYDRLAAAAALNDRDTAAARRVLEEILNFKDSATLRIALARVALKLNDPGAALIHVRRALELEPGNGDATKLMGEIGN